MEIDTVIGLGTLNGYDVIEDANMVEHYQVKKKRTFKERLFSLHWFTAFKFIHKTRPKTQVLVFEDKLIMHPTIARKLSESIGG